MSWFFGKKKQYKDPTIADTTNNDATSADDYIFVEKQSGLYPNINSPDLQGNSNNAVYPPSLPGSVPPETLTKQNQMDFHGIINAIPFKLNSDLEKALNSDLDIDLLRINEISYLIERIQNSENVYNFNVENSVISEMNSQTEE